MIESLPHLIEAADHYKTPYLSFAGKPKTEEATARSRKM